MLVVTRNWWPGLAKPIHLKVFGANKTWRGVIVMTFATVPGVYVTILLEPLLGEAPLASIAVINAWILGTALGLAYVLAELPNSYLKRRLQIAPGERAPKYSFLFSLLDQADSAIGCALVYWLLIRTPWAVLFWMILIGPSIHLAANLFLYGIGLRKHPV